MWKIYTILSLAILLAFGWMCAELRVFELIPVEASDTKGSQVTTKPSDEFRKLLESREKDLKKREDQVLRKHQENEDKEKFLTQQIARYEKIIQDLTGRVSELENLRADKADTFRGVFEKMEPKKASKILEDMDSKMAASVVASLKRDRAGEILSEMSPEKARAITEFILGQRKIGSLKGQSKGTQVSTEGNGATEKGGDE